MPTVRIENVGLVRFPDDMTDDQIVDAIETDILKLPSKQVAISPPGESPLLAGSPPNAIPQAFPIAEQQRSEMQAANTPELTPSEALNMVMTPQVQLPRITKEGTALRGVENLVASVPEFVTAPIAGPLTVAQGIPGVAHAVNLALGAHMVKGGVEAVKGAKNNEELVTGVGTAAMGVLGAAAPWLVHRKAPATASVLEQTVKETAPQLVPEGRRLPAPRTRMPEFTESTIEPGGPPLLRLPAPGETGGTILLPESETGPRSAGYRIKLPIEPETAAKARQVWSKPIDIEAQVVGSDALRQMVSMTEEVKTAGKPYEPPSVSVDLRQLERVMQRNTVSKVESWADEVLHGKMKDLSANPFFDPEFLAAAAVKGAILVKRGVVDFGEWSNEMRKQFGRGMDDRLPELFKQAVGAYGADVKNKPVPPVTEQAPVSPTPTAAAVSEAKTPGVTAPEMPPAISEATTPLQKTQTVFDPEALEAPASKSLGIASTLSKDVEVFAAKTKSWLLKYWRTRGHLPKEAYELKKETEHIKAQIDHMVRVRNKALATALKEHYGFKLTGRRIPKAVWQTMDDYLHGNVANQNQIPPKVRGVLDTQRAEIDAFTDKIIDAYHREMVKHPVGSAAYEKLSDFIDLMRGNKGIYVNRSYEFFDTPEKPEFWYKKLSEGVKVVAEKYLMDNSPVPLTKDEAQRKLLMWLSDLRDTPSFGSSKLGSKDLSIFMKRKVIAPEIRAVLGEYHSPFVNYARSVTKMGSWVANHNFLNEVRRQGMGRFLFESEAKAPPEFHVQIAGEGSETMSPLNGLRTTQEIADAFREFDAIQQTGPFARTFLAANAWSKQMATTHSLMTQAGNLLSRPYMALMAGHINVTNLPKSMKTVWQDLLAKDSSFVDMLYKEGVLGDSANWGELKAALKDAAIEDVAPGDLVAWNMMRMLKKGALDTPRELYRMSDELGNVYGFLCEREFQARINPKLSTAELNKKAAEVTRKLYPFYSETPKGVQAFRKLPTGPFVTFRYQMYRNTVNSIRQTISELRSSNPAERRVGATRMVSQLTAISLPWILQEGSKAMLGISKQQEEDFRRTRPDWDKNSKWMFTNVNPEKGEITAYNLSFRDPYSGITDPSVAVISGVISGKDPFQIIVDAIKEGAQAWASPQIFWKAATEAAMGQTVSGNKLFNKTDSEIEKTKKRVDHVLDALKPGTMQRAEKRIIPAFKNEQPMFGRQLEPTAEVIREMGFALETVNYGRWLANQSYKFRELDSDAESVFHKTVSRTKTTTDDDIFAAYQDADRRRLEVWREMRKDLLTVLRNGVTLESAVKMMRARGVTATDASAIAAGVYTPMPVSDRTMALARERKRTVPLQQINEYRAKNANKPLDEK